MPGQPITRQLADRIAAEGGDSVILGRVASGEAVKAIAEDHGVSYETLRKWINATPERRTAYEQAKSDSADALVEEAGEILDTADDTSAPAVTKAVKRADHRRWLAGKRDREQYGDEKGLGQVAGDLGALFLGALQAAGSMADHEQIPEAEVELIGEPEGDDSSSPD